MAILSLLVATSNAFSVTRQHRFTRSLVAQATTIPKPLTSEVSAVLLRSLELFDQDGAKKDLDSLMGDGKSVVIFLRHLG